MSLVWGMSVFTQKGLQHCQHANVADRIHVNFYDQ